MPKLIDLKGQQFGRLTVITKAEKKSSTAHWICKCECGTEKIIDGQALRKGLTISCGCYYKEQTSLQFSKHQKSFSRLYNIWKQMKQRCYNEKKDNYKWYGGRGIKVCDEWRSDFQSFLEWSKSNGYQDYLTIDRIDNDGDYSPLNCRWVTMKEQHANKRTTKGRKFHVNE